MSEPTEPTTTKSPYELLRERKIARNRSRLRELGLLPPPLPPPPTTTTTQDDSRINDGDRCDGGNDDDVVSNDEGGAKQLTNVATTILSIRRSSRKRKKKAKFDDEETKTDEHVPIRSSSRRRTNNGDDECLSERTEPAATINDGDRCDGGNDDDVVSNDECAAKRPTKFATEILSIRRSSRKRKKKKKFGDEEAKINEPVPIRSSSRRRTNNGDDECLSERTEPTATATATTATTKSPYELLREQKIARNRSRLRELGLLPTTTKTTTRDDPRINEDDCVGRNEETNVTRKIAPTRKSSRQRKNGGNDNGVVLKNESAAKQPKNVARKVSPIRRSSRRRKNGVGDQGNGEARTDESPKSTKPLKKRRRDDASTVAPSPSPSLPSLPRNVRVHVGKICERYLGRFVSTRSTKAAVVDELVRCSRSVENNESPLDVSFNWYSGVLEWKNDALCLWVNVFEKDTRPTASAVCHDFVDRGTKLTWFGGARTHDDSPVVKRLLDVSQKPHCDSYDEPNGVLLFCRTFDTQKRPRPYACLGRLGYHEHVPGVRPLKFVWSLLDAKELRRRLTSEFGEVEEDEDVISLYRWWLTTTSEETLRPMGEAARSPTAVGRVEGRIDDKPSPPAPPSPTLSLPGRIHELVRDRLAQGCGIQ